MKTELAGVCDRAGPGLLIRRGAVGGIIEF